MQDKQPTASDECVRVMVRCRPMNSKEIQMGSKNIVEVDKAINQIIIRAENEKATDDGRGFTFDAVYGADSTQRSVYDEGAFSLVESVMAGYNGTIFAYGQTGCGKTHTMIGITGGEEHERGIIPNAFDHIFHYFDDAQNMKKKFLIRCSYLEIYNEMIRDLLGKNLDERKDLKESKDKGVYVKDLTTCIVKKISEIQDYMEKGNQRRKTGETAMNAQSSRSHSIFTIYVETAEKDDQGEQRIKAGKLNLVDLAGSERQSKTNAVGDRLKEATKINLSLSALGNVISSLVEGKYQHIPYRDSKLTRLLQDSLGGNTKTVMIAAVSPADYNYEETLTTLRYASRAKHIKNKPRVNQDPKDALLKQYEDEIKKLREIIEQSKRGQQISTHDLGSSIKMINQGPKMKGQDKEESVEDLLKKLAKKGKKVKLLEETASVRELPKQEDDDDMNERDRSIDIQEEMDEIDEEAPSTKKKKKKGKKQSRNNLSVEEDDDQIANGLSAQKLIEQQQQQQQIIDQTNQQLLEEANKRENLENILKQMEQQLVQGGDVLEEKEREQAQVQRKMQLALEEEKVKQMQLLDEKERQEEELLEKDKQYNSMQEEVDDCRKIIKKLKKKLGSATNELKDIHKENAERNEELLDTVREQAKELDFLNQITRFLMNDEQMYKVKEKTQWDEDRRKWKLAPFIIKAKEVQFPKLNNANEFIKEEQENNEIHFSGMDMNDNNHNQVLHQQGTPSGGLNGGIHHSNNNTGRKAYQNRLESSASRRRIDPQQNYGLAKGMSLQNASSNSYMASSDMIKKNNRNNLTINNDLIRNESKSSANFNNDQIRQQQNRLMRLNNDNYVMDSPDVNQRKINAKAGVHLAPMNHPHLAAGRSSMMSINGNDNDNNLDGTESHPILRVQNYKKPQLEKLNHQNAQINQNQFEHILNQQAPPASMKIHGIKKRETAQLAPLNPAAFKNNNLSQMSQY